MDPATPGTTGPGTGAGTPGRPRARLPWLHRVLLALAILLIGAEAAVRLADWRAGRDSSFFIPDQPLEAGQYMAHPYVGFVLRPGFESRPESKRKVHINGLGMRGAEMAAAKPPGTYRILCLGGSTTFGTGATADDRSYPAQLERLLNVHAASQAGGAARHYEVGNCGVSGYSSAEDLVNLEMRLLEFDPDAILLYEGANDGRIVQARGFKPDYSHARRSVALTEFSPTETWLLRHVRLYAWLTRGTNPQEQLGALANYIFVPGFEDMGVPSDQWLNTEGMQAFLRNLRSMIAICKARGIQPVLSTVAMRSLQDPGPNEHMHAFLRASNEATVKLAEEEGVPCIDVGGPLTEKVELFDDYIHFNDAGSLRHAQVVLSEAQRLGLFGLPRGERGSGPPAAAGGRDGR